MPPLPGRIEARFSRWYWTAKDPVAWHRRLKRALRRREKQAWKTETAAAVTARLGNDL